MNTSQRIQKIIANRSSISRRKAEDLIRDGKVFVNDVKAELGQKASFNDKIEVDGKLLKSQKKFYIALHKPEGYVSTTEDTHGRKTVLDLLPEELQGVKPAGRLDLDSEGLIILSNDGEFIQKLTHPKYESTKEYIVKIIKDPTKETLEKLTSGTLELDGYTLNPMPYTLIDKNTLKITLSEGRKRQIREVFKLLGHHVVYLRRLRVGSIELGSLKKGEYRHLTKEEVLSFG